MIPRPLLKVGYAVLLLKGLLDALAPRRAIALTTGVWRLGFENVGELEAREWYVEVTRVLGVGAVVAGLAGLAVSRSSDGQDEEAVPEDDTSEDDDGNGPIQVNVD